METEDAKEPTAEETPVEFSVDSKSDLVVDGQTYLAEYIGTYGAEFGMSVSNMALMGGFVASGVVAYPVVSESSKRIAYSLADRVPRAYGESLLKDLIGPYALETDLGQNEQLLTTPSTLATVIPEMKEVLDVLRQRTHHIFPFTLAMTLEPEERSLVALALEGRDYRKSAVNVHNGHHSTIIRYFDEKCTPSAPELVEVAQRYQVKKIMKTLEDVDKAKKRFHEVWKLR